MTKGVIDPEDGDDGFFTLFADTPAVDRRFLLALAGGLTIAAAGAGIALAASQRPAGSGFWAQGEVKDWIGIVETRPYPALRFLLDGRPMRALLSTQGKCAVGARLQRFDGGPARLAGSLIRRGDHLMIAAKDGPGWIGPADLAPSARARLGPPIDRMLARGRYRGEILDAKCWFGAMRPAHGKTHKACAALCIRGGLPPAFFMKAADGRSVSLLLTDEERRPMPKTILPYVADPVSLEGRLFLVDNLSEFRVDPASIERL